MTRNPHLRLTKFMVVGRNLEIEPGEAPPYPGNARVMQHVAAVLTGEPPVTPAWTGECRQHVLPHDLPDPIRERWDALHAPADEPDADQQPGT